MLVRVGGLSTVMATVLVAVSGPPLPVLPWSLMSILSVAAPLKAAVGANDTPFKAVFCAAIGPVEVTSAVPLPVTTRPAVVESVAVPLVEVSVTTTLALPASTSATLITPPEKTLLVLVGVVALAGAAMVGALLTALTVTVACASGVLFVMRSFTVTAMSRLVVVGFCDALL